VPSLAWIIPHTAISNPNEINFNGCIIYTLTLRFSP